MLEVEAKPLRGLVQAVERAEIRVVADPDRVTPGHRLDGDHTAMAREPFAQAVRAHGAVVGPDERQLDQRSGRHHTTVASSSKPGGSSCKVTCSMPTSSPSIPRARSSTAPASALSARPM